MNKKLKQILKFVLYIGVVLLMVYFLEWWGVLGILIFILVIAGHRAWKMRDSLKSTLEYMETMIWGKPLSKNLWDKGEMKEHKVKLVWGKKRRGVKFEKTLLLYPAVLLLFIGVVWEKDMLSYTSMGLFLVYLIFLIKDKWRSKCST